MYCSIIQYLKRHLAKQYSSFFTHGTKHVNYLKLNRSNCYNTTEQWSYCHKASCRRLCKASSMLLQDRNVAVVLVLFSIISLRRISGKHSKLHPLYACIYYFNDVRIIDRVYQPDTFPSDVFFLPFVYGCFNFFYHPQSYSSNEA